MPALPLHGYYAILDVKGESLPAPGALRARAEVLLSARPCVLQLRAKQWGAAVMREGAATVLSACRAAGVLFCVNDRVDVALAVGADAVHVGQEDLPLAAVRRIAAGRPLAVGVSTHDEEQARAAVAAGADYIGFGPVFSTRSKDRPAPVVGLAALARVSAAASVPVVAIGGIGLETVSQIAAAGARAAALISAIEEAPDPAAAGRKVAEAFGQASA